MSHSRTIVSRRGLLTGTGVAVATGITLAVAGTAEATTEPITDALQANNNLADVADVSAALSNLGAEAGLVSTAVKTDPYTATANQLVPADATSGAFSITLPSAPPDKTRVMVKKVDSSSNVVTVAASGSDVFDEAGGATSVSLSLHSETVTVLYAAQFGIWYVVADDISLSQLDAHYNATYARQAANLCDLTDPAAARVHLDAAKASTLAVDATVGVNAVAWDGATDDTAKLAALATEAVAAKLPLRLPPGTGMISNWTPPSGLTVIGAGPGATTVKMHPSATGSHVRTIDVSNTSDVTFQDLTIDGNMPAFSAVTTEQKHGIVAKNVKNLHFRDAVIANCKGDGLYVGKGAGHSTGVSAYRLRCLANYRNNLTIADLTDGKFIDCDFKNASGTAPQAGVDIEPNDNTYAVSDIRFTNCSMSGNAQYGVAITSFSGGEPQEGIKFIGCSISNNGFQGVYLYGVTGAEFIGADIIGNSLDGVIFQSGTILDVSFLGGRIIRNGHHGINCQPTTGSTVKNTKVVGTTILDNGIAAPNTYHGMLWDVAGSAANAVSGLIISGVTTSNRAGPTQKYGCYCSKAVSNLIIDSNDFSGNVSGAVIFNDDANTRKRGSNTNVGVNDVAGITTSATLGSAQTKASCTVTSAITLTLPAAPEPTAEYIVYDAAGNAATKNITIVPNKGHSWANVTGLVLNVNFSIVKLYFRASKWFVLSKMP